MRTRLDEIVEEEAKVGKWYSGRDPHRDDIDPTHLGPTFKRIAERAFRHGVEQCDNAGEYLGADAYRPAPAEEKPCPYCVDDGPEGNPCLQHTPAIFGKATATASDGMKDRFPIRYDWKYVGGQFVTSDRRYGERRKGLEAQNWVHDHASVSSGEWDTNADSRPIYQVNDHGSFQYDRRGQDGKDRRK